jgi:hypothetical protein
MQGIYGTVQRLAVYTPRDAGFLADDLVRRLSGAGFQVVRIDDRAALKQYPLALALPEDFTHSVLAGPPVEIELFYPTGHLLEGYDIYRVGRACDQLLADLVVLNRHGRVPDAVQLAALVNQPRKLELRVESAGKARKLILGFQQSVPGFIVMFTLQVALTSGSVLLIAERRRGVLRRLASTPIGRPAIVASAERRVPGRAPRTKRL